MSDHLAILSPTVSAESSSCPHSQLKLRKERGQKPFTVLSCDNMPENGHVAQKMCAQMAEAADPELAEWIKKEVRIILCNHLM